jgi:para-nitrobenzyl esterase
MSGFQLSGDAPTAYSTYAGNHPAEKDAPVPALPLASCEGPWIDGVAAFFGVPYALPPVGPLRFAPASPAHSWRGQFDATQHGPIAR